ncbi:MAG TPA: spore germination protein GerW family protein [Methylovirgula sp.]|nr:spore germination protein GerW family protein [Methylovirgula sp.]
MAEHMAEQANEARAIARQVGETFGRAARVETVFGEPIREQGCTIVPVARARWGFGGASKEAGGSQAGGGGVRVDPVGIIVLRGGEAEFRPIGRGTLAFLIGLAVGLFVSRRRSAG